MSPLAAYNLMATNFSNDGMVVSTNTGNITTPTVAAGIIYGAGREQKSAPAILKLVMMFTMVGVGMKAIMSILSAGFGGLFKGAAGASLGSTAGFGTAVGGLFRLPQKPAPPPPGLPPPGPMAMPPEPTTTPGKRGAASG